MAEQPPQSKAVPVQDLLPGYFPWYVKVNSTLTLEYSCQKTTCEPCDDINLICSGSEMIERLSCKPLFSIKIDHEKPPEYRPCDLEKDYNKEFNHLVIFILLMLIMFIGSGFIVIKKQREHRIRQYQRLKN
jgi:hypothetical protein